jgi:hypothetical protein
MKKLIPITTILLMLMNSVCSNAQGPSNVKYAVLKMNILKERAINLGKKEHSATGHFNSLIKHFSNQLFKPEFSVDLLNDSGIRLFTISDVDFIPTIRVGARIKAGLTITL